MSRRLEKLIEQKAWETLTDYGYNDAHLLEQLTESVLHRLNEQYGPGGGEGPETDDDPLQTRGQIVYQLPNGMYVSINTTTGTMTIVAYINGQRVELY